MSNASAVNKMIWKVNELCEMNLANQGRFDEKGGGAGVVDAGGKS